MKPTDDTRSSDMPRTPARREADTLGCLHVPAGAYWGIHTARAVSNFDISAVPFGRCENLVVALAQVKKAAAIANERAGVLSSLKAAAIVRACDDILGGALRGEFVVDVIQGGAGTSTNMNMNEVIANRALEHLGRPKGDYAEIHPNDHVNASQSTNDVYPTALRLATWYGLDALLQDMASLRRAFERKSAEFTGILKIGRTQLQDAVPMTLGQEFAAFAVMISEDEERVRDAMRLLTEVNLGATAIGTGINAAPQYAVNVVRILAEVSHVPLVRAANLVQATQDTGAFLHVSGVLKRVACKLSKTCNDLRLLSSGPQAGFGDIRLPARQAGSSIMPGKVNPVIPEVVNQVAFEVIGNDVAITMASEGGQLQLNAFEPIIGWSLFKSISHLARACVSLRENCVEEIQANVAVLSRRVQDSVTIATALNPIIGYENAARLVKHALAQGGGIAAAAEALGVMPREQLARLLVPEILARDAAAAPAPEGVSPAA